MHMLIEILPTTTCLCTAVLSHFPVHTSLASKHTCGNFKALAFLRKNPHNDALVCLLKITLSIYGYVFG